MLVLFDFCLYFLLLADTSGLKRNSGPRCVCVCLSSFFFRMSDDDALLLCRLTNRIKWKGRTQHKTRYLESNRLKKGEMG